MRVAPSADGVSIWSAELFGSSEVSRIQDFLSRTFAVAEVQSVELRRATSFGRIRFGAVASPRQLWKKLGRALSGASDVPPSSATEGGLLPRFDAGLLHLGGPGTRSVHVTRVGGSLSTWRVRHRSENTLHLWHPVLRNRRDVVFRLEEELAAILGVEEFRASALTAGVKIRFDTTALTVERLAQELEKAWPRLLEGLDGPPSRKRFIAAGALLGLAFAGQYVVPALRPVAVAGVILYSFPNVVRAVKQLARGEVGVYALYSTGLGFMLKSGLPFTSTVMAVLMQFWPRLARRKIVSSQRRLFARHRHRPVWARIATSDGVDLEVSVDDLRKDDLIVVHRGELVPVDGVVQEGSAVVADGAPFRAEQVEHRSPGDRISAGAFVCDGRLTIRVERTGRQTSASYLASLLPHAPLAAMPSLLEVERIANRNAKPILALSALSLGLTRTLRPSQAVIRPDYVTGPRLSAQLSALQGLAHGAQEGIFFRDPAALDRLAGADVYVFDDTAGLARRRIEVATVETVNGVPEALVASYAMAACRRARTEQSLALATFTSSLAVAHQQVESVRHRAGVTRYRDSSGDTIEVATAQHIAGLKIDVPRTLQSALARRDQTGDRMDNDVDSETGNEVGDDAPSLRPLWVLRDGEIIGVVSFTRGGELSGKRVVSAIKRQNRRARFVCLSRGGGAQVQALAGELDIELSHGDLDPQAKANFIRGLGRKTVWVGDGTAPDARDPIAASTVSVSVAPSWHSRQDLADVLMPHQGLDALPAVIDVARAHESRLARDYRTVYATNTVGLGGAFLARFNALHTGLLSNVGTGIIYARHARSLDRLASAIEDERARLKRSALR
jgi:cation-transporting P-type ATPase C